MYLEKLNLTNFKNYEEGSFTFSEQINCIVGPNGSGKTNLLDAVYFLSLSKSAFHNQDALSIHHQSDFFIIDGVFRLDDKPVQITCSLQRGQRKVLLSDKKPYDRISEHIGRFPVVMLAPNDTDLVREHSEERRHFFDGVLSQLDPDYLRDYLFYHQILKQRNGTLKLFAERNYLDEELLETYNEPLLQLAGRIYQRRKRFIADFLPIVQKHYAYLSEAREAVDIIYESEVGNEEFPKDFRRNRQRDIQLQRTNKGVHKDDFVFEANGVALKKFGSQGQQKTFVIALKLAQFEQLQAEKGVKPMLLLDDIFDKLDDRRIDKLITLMEHHTFGQIFITDARPERTRELLTAVKAEVAYFQTEP
ncbi:DNA replication and repair protein RecF [Larkinella arboricola]|uniref:DNA replication and repair protein RecF n=1 Tax=Larkinella arboricola TaxID=643671 RepID=A0A327WX78_LARAB|nr:DNA replication and repair protein RecF [Larkinella arboricola]RAJ97932.1 DNA replication and repair protein RecF [Larkinella arboricola]